MLKNISFYKAIYFKTIFTNVTLSKALVISLFNQMVRSILGLAA